MYHNIFFYISSNFASSIIQPIPPVYGSGQLSIVYAPKSLQFKQTATPLPSSSLSEVYAAALGYPVIGSVDWSALTIKDPFGTPVVAVAVIVSGDDAALSVGKVTYQLSGDGAHGSIDELYTRLPKTEHLTLTAVSEDKKIAADIKNQKFVALKPESNAAERDFVAEVADLATLADRIDVTPEHSVFVSTSLSFDALAGSSSAARAEAQKLIVRAVEKLSASLQAKFNGEVLLTLASVEEETVVQRSKRQAAGETVRRFMGFGNRFI